MAADPLRRLLALREVEPRRIVGLMSGTSGDGVDAALVEVEGAGEGIRVRPLAFLTAPYPPALRREVLALTGATAETVCRLHYALGEEFARAALAVIRAAGLAPAEVHLIGSHGQTASHLPRASGAAGATLQLGEPAVIAERTGLPVIADFRPRDVAAGGEGAPLVPLADYLLFRAPGRVRALVNLGGIANVTAVPERLERLVAFDLGPGNMPLDLVAEAMTGGAEAFDRDGARAAQGRVDGALLAELLAHPFLAVPPPRSTGREAFGQGFVGPLLARARGRETDLLATLTRFVAEAIRIGFARWIAPRTRVDEVLVSGGGVHNRTLMAHLADCLAPVPVRSLAELGWDPDAKEAIAFAILANEALFGHPGNLPAATGARGPRVLGKIIL